MYSLFKRSVLHCVTINIKRWIQMLLMVILNPRECQGHARTDMTRGGGEQKGEERLLDSKADFH